jgi:hypothetical protein
LLVDASRFVADLALRQRQAGWPGLGLTWFDFQTPVWVLTLAGLMQVGWPGLDLMWFDFQTPVWVLALADLTQLDETQS